MTVRLATLATGIALGVFAQEHNESNAAYRRYDSLARNETAPLAGVLRAADEWVQTYERTSPDPRSVPPYLILARYYLSKGVRSEQVLPLLEKGVAELSMPGSFTLTRTQRNAPFQDDIERAMASGLYTQLRRYDKARELLAIAGRTLDQARTAEFDPQKSMIFEAFRFAYLDGSVRLAVAEGRKEEALKLERAILTNRKNVASREHIDEHRKIARQLWKELGRSGELAEWLLESEP